MKFELKWSAVAAASAAAAERKAALMEIPAASALLSFRIERILAVVELLSFLVVREDFFGRRHFDEFLLGHFLVFAFVAIGMPFDGEFAIRFQYLIFRRSPASKQAKETNGRVGEEIERTSPFNSKDFIIVSFLRLLQQLLRSIESLFDLLRMSFDLFRFLVVANGYAELLVRTQTTGADRLPSSYCSRVIYISALSHRASMLNSSSSIASVHAVKASSS